MPRGSALASSSPISLRGVAKPSAYERAPSFVDEVTVIVPDDEETSPNAISERQRADVLRAWRGWGTFRPAAERVQLVSDEVILDVWTVTRRLREAGVTDLPAVTISQTDKNGVRAKRQPREKVLAALKRAGRATIPALMEATGFDRPLVAHVLDLLETTGGVRRCGRTAGEGTRPRWVYEAVGGGT